ncbi:Hypothetical Protein sle_08060 [Streptomyces leeuwenhoekii]|uniref:Uncharacterized protein n=1 Tax=Streptomyces leeuwenhoekii TaxID=1437453 RepID=A0A0F7VLB3_STRLW|nr:Hypothetical Protein sle_08060 [Streptomyces leeuwenhoekii]
MEGVAPLPGEKGGFCLAESARRRPDGPEDARSGRVSAPLAYRSGRCSCSTVNHVPSAVRLPPVRETPVSTGTRRRGGPSGPARTRPVAWNHRPGVPVGRTREPGTNPDGWRLHITPGPRRAGGRRTDRAGRARTDRVTARAARREREPPYGRRSLARGTSGAVPRARGAGRAYEPRARAECDAAHRDGTEADRWQGAGCGRGRREVAQGAPGGPGACGEALGPPAAPGASAPSAAHGIALGAVAAGAQDQVAAVVQRRFPPQPGRLPARLRVDEVHLAVAAAGDGDPVGAR